MHESEKLGWTRVCPQLLTLDSGQHSLGLCQLSFLNFDLRGTNLQVDNLVVSQVALEVLKLLLSRCSKSCDLDNDI